MHTGRARTPHSPRDHVSLMEAVESRRLLAASLDGGLLVVEGTRRGDEIALTLDGARTIRVAVNGQQSTFPRGAVAKIRIVAGAGDDVVTLNGGSRPFTAGILVRGGDGNDTITGGAGADTLRGEDGADRLYGRGGRDLLQGGGGNDLLEGGDEDDRLFGDSGADDLRGNLGDDTLMAGRGSDTLHEDEGLDRLCGNADRDTFYFADSPKDVRDEAADETIAAAPIISAAMPFPAAGGLVSVGSIGGLIGNTLWTRTSIGSQSAAGGTMNLGGGGGGGVLAGSGAVSGSGSLTLTGIGLGTSSAGGLTSGTPFTPIGSSPVTVGLSTLSFLYRDVTPGTPLFGTVIGGVTFVSPRTLLARLGDVAVDGEGLLADGSTLLVPAGTRVTLAHGIEQSLAEGSATVSGPATVTLPSGNALTVKASWVLTIRVPAGSTGEGSATDVTSGGSGNTPETEVTPTPA